jgi:hypothetical protein
MSFDVGQIRRSKQAFRQRVAAQPIEQKLALLDALRERALLLHLANPMTDRSLLHEPAAPYRVKGT